jgi:hypothetical protein
MSNPQREDAGILLLKDGDGFIPTPVSSILLIRTDDPYIRIHTAERMFLERISFRDILTECSADTKLVKVHRCFAVRFDFERCIHKFNFGKKDFHIELKPFLISILKKQDDYFKTNHTLPMNDEGRKAVFRLRPPATVQLQLFKENRIGKSGEFFTLPFTLLATCHGPVRHIFYLRLCRYCIVAPRSFDKTVCRASQFNSGVS